VESIDGYLERLASAGPTPGGGSAAALIGAVAAALVAMVGRIRQAPGDAIVERADRLRADLREARARDEAAYAAVIAAQAMPKGDDAQRAARRDALGAALFEAAEAPLHSASLTLDVMRLARRLAEAPLGALGSDVACAAEFGRAAVAGCAENVRINHRYMKDEAAIREQGARLERLERDASEMLERVRAATG